MITEDMTLDKWLKFSKELREGWREYYDHRKENRKNGFIRDNVDSIINDVLMRAIFDTSKTLAKVTSTNLDPTKRPVRFRENLAKELTSNEPNRSSPSSNKPQTAEASSSSSSKDHTSPNREVTFAEEKEAGERLKLDYVDRNINRRRKNALIIEKQTCIQEIIYNDSKGIVRAPDHKVKSERTLFDDGHAASRKELEQEIHRLCGS
jgi:hypothetical protein